MATYVQEFDKIAKSESLLATVAPTVETPYHLQEAESFTALSLLPEPVTISPVGTLNTIPKFTGATTIGDSIMREVGGIAIVIGTDPLVAGDAGEAAPFRVGVTAVNKQLIEFGPGGGTTRARIGAASADMYQFRLNVNFAATALDNAAKASWFWRMGAGADLFAVSRAPAGSFVFVDLLTVKGTGEVDVPVGPLVVGVDPTGAELLRGGGNLRLNIGGGRALSTNVNGILIENDAGGWAPRYAFRGSAGTDRGGFGAVGAGDALTYFWIGTAYDTATTTQFTLAAVNPGVTGALNLGTSALPWNSVFANAGVFQAGSYDPGGGLPVAVRISYDVGNDQGVISSLVTGVALKPLRIYATDLSPLAASGATLGTAALYWGQGFFGATPYNISLAGSPTSVQQLQLGTSSVFGSVGTRFSGGEAFLATNASQPTTATDLWHQSLGSQLSWRIALGTGDLVDFSRAPSGQVDAVEATFWTLKMRLNNVSLSPGVTGGLTLGALGTRWGKLWGQDADFSTTVLVTGDLTAGARLVFTTAVSKIVPGATSLSHRNNADSADNILIADSGAITFRAGLSGITTLSLSGQLTSTLVTGTSPFVVASTTKVINLNADSLDDQSGAFYLDLANATGNLAYARLPTGGGVWANGGTLSITGGITTVAGLTSTAQVSVTGGANPTVAAAATLALGGGGITPNGTSIEWGDNTGWKLRFGTIVAAAFTPRLNITDTGLVEVVTGDLTITAGRFTFGAAVGKIVPGATSISLRNNADSADNLILLDAGDATLRTKLTMPGPLVLTTAASKIVPGATSLTLRNNADSADNLIILDAGDAAFRTFIEQTEMAAPATPAANKTRDYAKDLTGVSWRYWKDDAGVEHPHSLTLIDTQTFTATGAGTWTKPAGAVLVRVVVIGAGGGGGGGRGGAAGSVRQGGTGGGGGAMTECWYNAVDLGATEGVSVGVGGTAGTGGSSADGVAGGNGGDSWFGSATQATAKQWAYGGGGGGLGSTGTTRSGGSGGGSMTVGIAGGTVDRAGGSPSGGTTSPQGQGFGGGGALVDADGSPAQHGGAGGGGVNAIGGAGRNGGVSQFGGGGGAAGGGVAAANTTSAGGIGGDNDIGTSGGGGTSGAGGSGGSPGGAGAVGSNFRAGQGGGGGGSGSAGTGGAGGAGGAPGGGGGGGGGGTTTGGAGGVGARGEVRVYSFA